MKVCTCGQREDAARRGAMLDGVGRPPVYCDDFARCLHQPGVRRAGPSRPVKVTPHHGVTRPEPPGYEIPDWARSIRPPRRVFWRFRQRRPTRPGYFTYAEYAARRRAVMVHKT